MIVRSARTHPEVLNGTGCSKHSAPDGGDDRASHQIRSGELIELGRRRARIRAHQSLRNGDTLALTISVPESRLEKTQAMFRVSTHVCRKSDDDGHDYEVQFSTDHENLEAAGKLYARVRPRGIVEV